MGLQLTTDDLAQLIELGYEQRGVEFKGPGSRSDKHFFARVTKAVLGMSNNRDGGIIVLGVAEQDDSLTPVGLDSEQSATWKYDDTVAGLARFAEPPVNIDLDELVMEGMTFVALMVHEFDDVPILCAADYQPPILRKGACYVRSRGRRETTEIPTQAEFRELLEIAAEKRLRAYVAMSQRAGVALSPENIAGSEARYARELGEFL